MKKNTNKQNDAITPTQASNASVYLENLTQDLVADDLDWLLAKELRFASTLAEPVDSRTDLNSLGFKILGEAKNLFYKVIPPKGWEKETNGYWTIVKDDKGNERIYQFFKGAFYDTEAFLKIVNR